MATEMIVDKVKVTQVSFDEFTDIDFIPPSSFYCTDALQNYTFIHCQKRDKAQQIVDEIYGKGKYLIKAAKLQKGSGEVTCRGTNSAKGFAYMKKK